MSTGRKAIEPRLDPKPVIDDQQVANDLVAAAQLGKEMQGYGQGRDLVNQLLGQAQMAGAFEQFSRTVSVSKLAIVKENKLYQQLAGSVAPNGSELKGTWVEFCNLLGISDDKANEDIANLQAFGENALENMQRIGIGYRDLRQFRKLPADQRTALIEAAKEGDKASLLDLAEDLIAKHAKEKEALNKTIDDQKSELAAKQSRLDRDAARLNAQEDEIARLTAQPKPERTPELIEAERLRYINDAVLKTVSDIEAGLRSHFTLLENLFAEGEVPNHARLAQQQALSQIIQAARALAGDFGITLKAEDLERNELLWLTQAETLFGQAEGHPASEPPVNIDLLDSDED